MTARVDELGGSFNGTEYPQTIRTSGCTILVHGGKCDSCKSFRPTLRAMYSHWCHKKSPGKFANNRYLNTPEKSGKLERLASRVLTAEQQLKRLNEKIEVAANENGVSVDESLHNDLCRIMESSEEEVHKTFPDGTFQRLFWDQQRKASRLSDVWQMRWHPAMIRWCLNLKLLSTSAYHALRTSGFMKLPSERTLRDYTHYVKARTGFQEDVEVELVKEVGLDDLPEWKKHVVLLLDEMKIKESIVYDKHNAQVIGFVDLGDVNNQLAEFETKFHQNDSGINRPIATHILALMVRGIFMKLEFPYAHFPTTNLTGPCLFSIVWEAIERLEGLGFKVLVVTADGVSSNHKFFKLHGDAKGECCYKVPNPYTSENRSVFFVSDVPHLMKTTRNCWSNSFAHSNHRKLWVS